MTKEEIAIAKDLLVVLDHKSAEKYFGIEAVNCLVSLLHFVVSGQNIRNFDSDSCNDEELTDFMKEQLTAFFNKKLKIHSDIYSFLCYYFHNTKVNSSRNSKCQ